MVDRFRRCAIGAVVLLSLTACTSDPQPHRSPSGSLLSPLATSASATPSATPTASSTAPTAAAHRSTQPATRPTRAATPVAPPRPPAPKPTPASSTGLPLAYSTGVATRVITVVAPSAGSTTARLQAWQKLFGRWATHGAAVTAYVGSAGVTGQPSESLSATPTGSFTLTQAFGRNPNPGTPLPYTRTTPADWWISEPGPLYNTMQRCTRSCGFAQGDPNEHLYYTTPYYDYAVVIDYNRAPVTQGAGSAIFLHVAVGAPTAGCISIPMASLVELMRWLTPAAHPRILVGVGH